MVKDFVEWCGANQLQLNTSKTKEMVVDFWRNKPIHLPLSISGADVEVVRTYKCGEHLQEAGEPHVLPEEAGVLLRARMGTELDPLLTVAERRTLNKMCSTPRTMPPTFCTASSASRGVTDCCHCPPTD